MTVGSGRNKVMCYDLNGVYQKSFATGYPTQRITTDSNYIYVITIFGTGTDIMWGYMTKKKTDWSNVINSFLNSKKGSVTIHVVGQVVITKCMHHFDTNITSMN